MLAWMGGKRRLVKEQRARRKLQGVFDKVATKVKPAGVTAAKQPRLAREMVDAMAERLSRLPLSGEGVGPLSLDVAAILGPSAPLRLVARHLQKGGEQRQGSPAAASGTRAQTPRLGAGAAADDGESWHTPVTAAPVSKTNHHGALQDPSAPANPTSTEL